MLLGGRFPIKGWPCPSPAFASDNCQGSCTIVHILPAHEGGIYSEQLFTFDQLDLPVLEAESGQIDKALT